MKKVTLRELLCVRIVLAIWIAVYYWCLARNDWQEHYITIENIVGLFSICFFVVLAAREKRYKKEVTDEMAVTNLRRCDSICLKVAMTSIIAIAFLCVFMRFAISTEVIGYILMGLLVLMSVLRLILFCYMDAKGV